MSFTRNFENKNSNHSKANFTFKELTLSMVMHAAVAFPKKEIAPEKILHEKSPHLKKETKHSKSTTANVLLFIKKPEKPQHQQTHKHQEPDSNSSLQGFQRGRNNLNQECMDVKFKRVEKSSANQLTKALNFYKPNSKEELADVIDEAMVKNNRQQKRR